MVNHSSIFAVANHPMNSIKRQKDMSLKDETTPPPPRSEGVQYATGEVWRAITNSSRKNEMTFSGG